jgi:hypothetical protein
MGDYDASDSQRIAITIENSTVTHSLVSSPLGQCIPSQRLRGDAVSRC